MRPLITTLMNSPLKKTRQCQKEGSLCERETANLSKSQGLCRLVTRSYDKAVLIHAFHLLSL
ncbi:hypothetical protein I7I53_07838 [Histoplasma capsulatum var. duboisii H88]|uniref:Uncharacterized protein n=1 Tax=Ajellomyces capsulatus (strain H88) TaxID=544711 RepID=A0A8A1LJT9_AJEC8|nr:hypothetical protein I7I53_07838 [Histoplasma capsulatum var. duboisii H88]